MNKIDIYPNPFNTRVKINTGIKDSFTLVIQNLTGKMVYLQTFPGGQSLVNLESIPDGTYVFKVITGGRAIERTVIKM